MDVVAQFATKRVELTRAVIALRAGFEGVDARLLELEETQDLLLGFLEGFDETE